MADQYLAKIGIDLDEGILDKVTGVISNELIKVGGISKQFADDALERAKQYNDEINHQKELIENIDKMLTKTDLNKTSRKLYQDTRKEAEDRLKLLEYGGKDKDGKEFKSRAEVDALAKYGELTHGTSKFQKFLDGLSGGFSKATSGISKFSAGIGMAQRVVQLFVDRIGKALDDFAKTSNALSPLGAFGSQSQRSLMTRYGMTGTQALGFSSTLEAMGMDESQIGNMTADQRRVFESLQNFWNEGMGKLDPDALDRYTETMSKYQEMQAKFDMGMQMTVLKLVSNSPQFERMVGKIGDLMDASLEFMNSPAVQWVFDSLIQFLTSVITLLERGMRLISKIPGFGGGGSQITNNSSTQNSFNIYGTNYASNDELARQISYSLKSEYGG